jgi:thymidylate synthase (FAD)
MDAAASDAMVVRAARVSTKGVRSVEAGESQGLINYLVRNRHGSPFEHNMFTFLIQAPIVIAREHMRHRAGWSYNEESGRYKELEPLFYIPGDARKLLQVGKTGEYKFETGSSELHYETNQILCEAAEDAWDNYQELLCEYGVAKEVARFVLTPNLMTSYYATCNARSLMHFLSLRTEREDAQYVSKPMAEIAMVAEGMELTFGTLMPKTYSAFCEYGRVAP